MSTDEEFKRLSAQIPPEHLHGAQKAYERAKQQAYLNNMMQGMGNALGGGGAGGGYGGLGQQQVFGQAMPGIGFPTAPAPTKEEMMRDLLNRASKNAMGQYRQEGLVATIETHRQMVKELLDDFEEGASYLQAQIPMVEAAYKDRPRLKERLIDCLNRAYHELVAKTFGDN